VNPKEKIIKITRRDKDTGVVTQSDYLEVKWRRVWFNEEHPDWKILIDVKMFPENDIPKACLAKAEIYNDKNELVTIGWGYSTVEMFKRFVEKACTAAEGRALASIGYGTQWAEEYYEDTDSAENLVDSPVIKNAVEVIQEEQATTAQKEFVKKLVKDKKQEEILSMLKEVKAESIDTLNKTQASILINKLKGIGG
jgi:hypothetical protein